MKLSSAILSDWCQKQPPEITEADASKRGISTVEDLSQCTSLRKLNLSKNELGGKHPLAGLHKLSSLTWLNLSENKLDSLDGIQSLENLIGKSDKPDFVNIEILIFCSLEYEP